MRTFDTVWATLGLDASSAGPRSVAMGATIRRSSASAAALTLEPSPSAATVAVSSVPANVDATIAARHPGDLAIATLPRLSVRGLDPEGQLGTGDAHDSVPRDIAVTGLLGEGGMGRVLLGYQRSLRREVALKTVFPNASLEARSAVLSEGFITGHLEHPNIIPVHELGLDGGGMPLLVMKRVVGFEWSELLADAHHPAWARIPSFAMKRPEDRLAAHLGILMQVAQALAYAHGRGVVHRDLKPENVMIGESGEVYLVDWGVAMMVDAKEPHALVGTPAYLAPEMIDEELAVGPWTDVYLLGATLHAVLTGRPRHEGTELRTVLVKAYESKPVAYAPSVPLELAELCNRATARDAAMRPSSALEFHRAIASYMAHAGSLALADTANERLDELEAVLAQPTHDDVRAARLATECRFGFLMALREWPENPRARLGLRKALERLIEMEIARENGPAARTALAELEAASVDFQDETGMPSRLTDAVTRVEESYANRMRDRDELAKVHHDQDLSVAARQRDLLIGTIIAIILLFTGAHATLSSAAGGSVATPMSITVIVASVLVCSLAGVVVGRRSLLRNAVNREFVGALFFALAVILLHRLLALRAGDPVATTLRADMCILCFGAAIIAVHSSRSWFAAAAVMGLAAILAGTFPRYTEFIFPAADVLFFVCIAIGWRRDGRRVGG